MNVTAQIPFAEAVVLGSMLHPQLALKMGRAGGPGCPFGLALEAVGKERSWNLLVETWPWLDKPCDWTCACTRHRRRMLMVVMHVWDTHVMEQRSMTAEQFYRWLEALDPDAPMRMVWAA